ncbi:hypothetical protein [Faecalibacillus intestinalis]|uniref:hypothetical protein n=1 Tax=Faecalibacillus intestinalis TaxID=1982626 RepID=UPI003990C14E
MIKLEHVVEPSTDQMMFVIEGMRNPMNSWRKRDSELYFEGDQDHIYTAQYWGDVDLKEVLRLGPNDKTLMKKLAKAGTDHRKFMRMMPVYVRITAPLYWWKEFDTYKVGTVANSCSTMHKIQTKEFKLCDFSTEHMLPESIENINNIIDSLNAARNLYLAYDEARNYYAKKSLLIPSKKQLWWQLIQLLPSSYNQTRNVMLNYEVLYNIYHARKNHKLDEWREFCKWIETLEFSFLITGEDVLKEGLQEGLQPGA